MSDIRENRLHFDGSCMTVIMPTLNEAFAIRKVVTDIRREIPKAEIIVIDSSTDETPIIAAELGCKVIRQFPSEGQDSAMYTGFIHSTGDLILTLDCDNTYPTSAIKKMIDLIESGYDLVSASRLQPRPASMPFPNYAANVFFTWLAFLICGIPSKDLHTGMRCYRKKALLSFEYDYMHPAAPVELQLVPIILGFRCTEINIHYGSRIGTSKLGRLHSTIWTLKRLWKWRFFFNARRKQLTRIMHHVR